MRAVMTMPGILGDYRAFFAMQKNRLEERNIDVAGYSISHLAFRTEAYDEYLEVRKQIEQHCVGNVENVWNGRPISKLLLKTALDLGDEFDVSLIELIPPVHEHRYRMGLEHVGFVLGDGIDEFGRVNQPKFSGQQFQSPVCEPFYISFDDLTNVKFYRESLMDVCIKEGHKFDRFTHVADWS